LESRRRVESSHACSRCLQSCTCLGMFIFNSFKSRRRLEAENLFLHHQLSITLRQALVRVRLFAQHRANEASKRLESIPEARALLPPLSATRMRFGRVVILRPGLGSYRDKIQPGANRSFLEASNRRAFCFLGWEPSSTIWRWFVLGLYVRKTKPEPRLPSVVWSRGVLRSRRSHWQHPKPQPHRIMSGGAAGIQHSNNIFGPFIIVCADKSQPLLPTTGFG